MVLEKIWKPQLVKLKQGEFFDNQQKYL